MNLKSILETILFVRAEPTSISMLAKFTKHTKEEVARGLADLMEEYKERGFTLLYNNDEWQLASNPVNADIVERLVKSEFTETLSRSGLETLAIIAYKGPISRIEVEYLRGVNSSFTIRNLLMRGLVERVENPKDARSYHYRVTFDFLKHFGLTNMDQLPRFEEFKNKHIEIAEEKPDADAPDESPLVTDAL
ncbi:MAG: SMC-Scp complex subunit ScpB [bacterium]|nr:SMC-Scp complex subunit ScpB [bacterium]